MRRMLVTGAAGFIGSNFVHFWAEQHAGDEIVGLDALTYAGNLASLEPLAKNEKFTFIKGDIRDGDAVREIIKHQGIDTIVHFAAESHVDRSIHGPDPFIDTNVRGTHELLKAARAIKSPMQCAVAENDTQTESTRAICEAVHGKGIAADLHRANRP